MVTDDDIHPPWLACLQTHLDEPTEPLVHDHFIIDGLDSYVLQQWNNASAYLSAVVYPIETPLVRV